MFRLPALPQELSFGEDLGHKVAFFRQLSKRSCLWAQPLRHNAPMSRLLVVLLSGSTFLVSISSASANGSTGSEQRFYYDTGNGHSVLVRIIHRYWRRPVVHPPAKIDPRIDPRLQRAATIAEERANAHSKLLCWQYVKCALLKAGVNDSYPKTAYASEAGDELTNSYGFKKLPIHDPYAAPLGAILVYKGHVEIRAKEGFVSDYRSKYACFYPLLAVYGKFSADLATTTSARLLASNSNR